MLGKLARLGLACVFLGNAGVAAAEEILLSRFTWNSIVDQNAAATLHTAEGDVIRFLDGSELHGELRSIVPGQGVRWQHPDAKKEIDFRTDNIGSIHFANVEAAKRSTNTEAAFKPSCQVSLTDGDVFYGAVPSLDEGRLALNTAFAGEAKVPRASVRSIAFLPRDFAVVYDGPLAAKEWLISPTNAWSFRDGVFVNNIGSGSLLSDFDVPGSVTVEFDLAWDGVFAFMVNLYLGPQAGGAIINSYFLSLSSAGVDGRRQTAGAVSPLSRSEIPGILQKGKCRFAIQCNQKDGTLALFADDQLIKRWADKPVLLNHGLRVLFADATGRKGVRLSNIRVMSWQGVEPVLGAVNQTNLDSVSLINRDIARGKITAIDGGNLKLLMGERTFTVPLTRVTRIDFAAAANAPAAPPEYVRAWLTDGGRVSFQVERWDKDKVAARSAVFGDFILQSQSVRELEFNLGRPKNEPSAARSDLRGLDD